MAQAEWTKRGASIVGLPVVLEVASNTLSDLLAPLPAEDEPGDMLTLWYARSETVVFGVWVAGENEYENGDGEWHRGITGWVLPSSPPWLELVFRLPECEAALWDLTVGPDLEAREIRAAVRAATRGRRD